MKTLICLIFVSACYSNSTAPVRPRCTPVDTLQMHPETRYVVTIQLCEKP